MQHIEIILSGHGKEVIIGGVERDIYNDIITLIWLIYIRMTKKFSIYSSKFSLHQLQKIPVIMPEEREMY